MNTKDKEILNLKGMGKSLREIAEEVGISHVAVKKRLDRLTEHETVNQRTPINDDSIIDASHHPEMNDALITFDTFISDLELKIRKEFDIPQQIDIIINTPNGWKIERTSS